MLELLSYGEYDQLFISVICFLNRTRLILEEQKTWKLREASVQKFLRIIWIKLFVIWQVLKPPLRKLSLGRFFRFHEMAKSWETGYPIFINNFLKPERVVCSKCKNCSSIKMTSLKLAKSAQFFFHANYRILVCEPTTKYFWWNRLPVHVNMSWTLGLKWFWMKHFSPKQFLVYFVTTYSGQDKTIFDRKSS